MNPLSFNRKWLILLSVCPLDTVQSKKVKVDERKFLLIERLAFTSAIILTIISALIASVVFFLKLVSKDLEVSFYALSVIISLSGSFYILLIALFN